MNEQRKRFVLPTQHVLKRFIRNFKATEKIALKTNSQGNNSPYETETSIGEVCLRLLRKTQVPMSPEKPAGLTSPVKKEEFYPTGLTEDPFFSLCPEDEEDWASSFLNAAGVANPSLTSASKKKTSNIDAKHTRTSKIHNDVAGMGKYCYQPTEIHEITVPVSQDTKPDGFLTVAMDQEWTLASPKPRYVAHGNNLELLSNQQLLPTESQPLKLPTQAEKFEQSQELEKLNDFACWVTDDQDTRDLPNLQIANQIDAIGVSSPSHSPKKTSDTVTVEPPR